MAHSIACIAENKHCLRTTFSRMRIFIAMNREAIYKFILAFITGSVGMLVVYRITLSVPFSLLAGWNLFGLIYVAISVYVFSKVRHNEIRKRCSSEDLRSWLLFLLVVAACAASLITVLSFVESRKSWPVSYWLSSVAGIGAIIFSWMMVHISFTFRYAHLYYGDDNRRYARHAHGLNFPEETQPDYFDFAYFAFVIGMTFQVSDVVITSKGVRRLALLHSLISFVFNTVIIAMTISELVNLD